MYIKVDVTVNLPHLNYLNSHIHFDHHLNHYLFPLNLCVFHCQGKKALYNVQSDTCHFPFPNHIQLIMGVDVNQNAVGRMRIGLEMLVDKRVTDECCSMYNVDGSLRKTAESK